MQKLFQVFQRNYITLYWDIRPDVQRRCLHAHDTHSPLKSYRPNGQLSIRSHPPLTPFDNYCIINYILWFRLSFLSSHYTKIVCSIKRIQWRIQKFQNGGWGGVPGAGEFLSQGFVFMVLHTHPMFL